MATLREYFDTDFPAVLNAGSVLSLTLKPKNGSTETTFEIPARVHYDFDSGTKYISFFIAGESASLSLCEALISNLQWAFDAVKGIEVQSGYPGQNLLNASDLKFSGRVFFYVEGQLTTEQIATLEQVAVRQGLNSVLRTSFSAQERSRYEKPLAFISHDSRDKELIARPLALGLSKVRCPVWYDEFSLKVGDSLRGSIEKGLKKPRNAFWYFRQIS